MRALITGITGQDGSYLAELLLSKGYEVHGLVRRSSTFNTERIDHLHLEAFLHHGDLTDATSVQNIVRTVQPTEIYHLGAQSQVRLSFDIPEYTADVDAIGTLRLLEAARENGKPKFYMASSSELYGQTRILQQDEDTPFEPCSPYGVAKQFAYWTAVNYRKAYDMFVCNGILFNHESPRRGPTFVSRKIARAAARISKGLQDKLYLGNLDARRDWGYAPEFVDAMYRMMQHSEPDDYVIATGHFHTVREFLDIAFEHVNLDWSNYVEQDGRLLRPNEVHSLWGNYGKAKRKLGWEPKVKFEQLVRIMVEAELNEIHCRIT